MGHNNKINFIEDLETSKQDTHWKATFALNKYENEFRVWLKENEPWSIDEKSKASEHYSKLKEKCNKLLHTPFQEIQDVKYYNYAFWWCKSMNEVETVQDRIKRIDKHWSRQETGNLIKSKWEHTDVVKNKIKGSGSSDPDDNKYKSWCDENLQKKFYEEMAKDDFYQDEYLMIREVCQVIP